MRCKFCNGPLEDGGVDDGYCSTFCWEDDKRENDWIEDE